MNYNDVNIARDNALRTLNNADIAVRQAANLITNRLRSSGVSGSVLCELKKELKNFNMHTCQWKD